MHMECSPVRPQSLRPVSQDTGICAFPPALSRCPSSSQGPEGDPLLKMNQPCREPCDPQKSCLASSRDTVLVSGVLRPSNSRTAI